MLKTDVHTDVCYHLNVFIKYKNTVEGGAMIAYNFCQSDYTREAVSCFQYKNNLCWLPNAPSHHNSFFAIFFICSKL